MRTLQYYRNNRTSEPGDEVDVTPLLADLRYLAWRALNDEKLPKNSVIFCIQICQLWSELATLTANPDITAQTKPRLTEDGKFLLGHAHASLNEYAVSLAPDLKERADLVVDQGSVRLIFFYPRGIFMMDIESKNQIC